MGICAFSEEYLMLDVTAVDNLFIEEYMLRAPGDYVKVYLYGLRVCYSRDSEATLEKIAGVLGLDEDMVADAFSYWETQGLVRRLSDNPPSYEYASLRKAVLTGSMRQIDPERYPAGDFNSSVRGMMSGRVLHAADYNKIFSWIDEIGFSPDAVLMIINFYTKETRKKGAKPPTVASIEKKVNELAKDGILTTDAVRDSLFLQEEDVKQLKALLRHMGIIKPAPSVDELNLYRKWRQWGFSTDVLKDLCKEMTRIQSPNMAYLDKIVENYHDMGIVAASDIESYNVQAIMPLKELMGELGLSSRLTKPMADRYLGWIAEGFEHDALIILARDCKKRGGTTLKYFEERLGALRERGAFTAEALSGLHARGAYIAQLTRKALAIAGEPREPNASERAQTEGWLAAGTPEQLIPAAAELAKSATNKMAYMASVLKSWRDQGITSPEQAKAAPLSPVPDSRAKSGRASKEVAEHRYDQRSYDEKELESMLSAISQTDGENE